MEGAQCAAPKEASADGRDRACCTSRGRGCAAEDMASGRVLVAGGAGTWICAPGGPGNGQAGATERPSLRKGGPTGRSGQHNTAGAVAAAADWLSPRING